ncbi:MAG TPA: hypothetical protein VN975_06770 [Xanthobacteraceae bacterium]|nr:hypothetical protein [Xanthobacteraceae bacterium]
MNLLCAPAPATVSVTQDASFVLGFGGKLPAGHSTLLAQIIVNAKAMTAEIQRMPIKIASKP